MRHLPAAAVATSFRGCQRVASASVARWRLPEGNEATDKAYQATDISMDLLQRGKPTSDCSGGTRTQSAPHPPTPARNALTNPPPHTTLKKTLAFATRSAFQLALPPSILCGSVVSLQPRQRAPAQRHQTRPSNPFLRPTLHHSRICNVFCCGLRNALWRIPRAQVNYRKSV